jgi:uncharacterized membrane protein
MADTLANWFISTLNGVPPQLIILIISMIPILELRGGLIAAALLKINILHAIPICILGNLLPIPFILLLITPIFKWMKKTKLLQPMVEKLEAKSMEKSEQITKYEFWGLAIFVGIPLPGTGGWTGALIAALLEMQFKKSILSIFIGLFMATAIMCTITYGIPYIISLF